MSVRKEDLLNKVSGFDILNHYLKPYHQNGALRNGKNISNPFLPEKQKTPSFNIFDAGANEWRYKDFATDDSGDCFDLVMKLFNLSFPESLEKINSDLYLLLDSDTRPNRVRVPSKPVRANFSIKDRSFSQPELNYWLQYGITEETLQKFNVKALLEFHTLNKEGQNYTVKSNSVKFIFAYDNIDWVKIYKPKDEKQFRFQYLGIKAPDFIFGWNQLPEKGESVFITGGEKDVMSLFSKGFPAIALNSETASLNKHISDDLKTRFTKVIILYDNDETGLKQSERLAIEHNLNRLILPEISNNGKDISDYFASSATIEQFEKLMNNQLQIAKVENNNPECIVINSVELLALGNIKPKYLIEPIFPQSSTAVLAGKPDTGKSQLARQLCIHIATGVNDFLGFPITAIHHSALYVATEDNIEATRYLLSKQMEGLQQKPIENLRFIFADTMEQEEIVSELDNALAVMPSDIVVIDSFGDIFTGKDSNNNMAMRNTVKEFNKIAKNHNCLILFVHHTNKGSYRLAPGQEHIRGGSGLIQKVRLAIQLSEGDGYIRYFTVVKGNYCPKEYKQNAMELEFSETNFLFKNTGKLVPIAELGDQFDAGPKEEKFNELKNLAEEIFGDNILSYSSFGKEFCELTGKSIPTAKRAHTNLKKMEIIVECNGGYRLVNPLESNQNIEIDENETEDPF